MNGKIVKRTSISINKELHKQLRIEAAKLDIGIREYVESILEKRNKNGK